MHMILRDVIVSSAEERNPITLILQMTSKRKKTQNFQYNSTKVNPFLYAITIFLETKVKRGNTDLRTGSFIKFLRQNGDVTVSR